MLAVIKIHEWMKLYNKIINIMGFDPEKDKQATKLLADYLINNNAIYPGRILKFMLSGRCVLVFGAGPSLDYCIRKVIEYNLVDKCVLISADGATKALVEYNIYPDIIVSDLDGDIISILKSISNGSIPVIHAHGDNIDKLKAYINKIFSLTRFFVGTTQVEPIPPVKNFGGFTDGDRAVFLAANFNSERIIMLGMDFGDIIGKYSKPWLSKDIPASEIKIKKLNIAYDLISWLSTKFRTSKIYTISDIVPKGVEKIDFKDIQSII